MTTHEMVERMLVDFEDDGASDLFDPEIDESLSDAELRVLLAQLPDPELHLRRMH
jgi:hypothetical protein